MTDLNSFQESVNHAYSKVAAKMSSNTCPYCHGTRILERRLPTGGIEKYACPLHGSGQVESEHDIEGDIVSGDATKEKPPRVEEGGNLPNPSITATEVEELAYKISTGYFDTEGEALAILLALIDQARASELKWVQANWLKLGDPDFGIAVDNRLAALQDKEKQQ